MIASSNQHINQKRILYDFFVKYNEILIMKYVLVSAILTTNCIKPFLLYLIPFVTIQKMKHVPFFSIMYNFFCEEKNKRLTLSDQIIY